MRPLRPLRRRYYESPDVLFRWHAGGRDLTTTRSTPATYRDRSGVIRTVGPGVLRLDWQDGRPYALVEGAGINLAANADGRPIELTGHGTTPPSVTLESRETPFGGECWRVEFPDPVDSGYDGSRVRSDSFPIEEGQNYGRTVWIAGDAEQVNVAHTGSNGWSSMDPTGRTISVGGLVWCEYGAMQVAAQAGSNYLSITATASSAGAVIWVAAHQVEPGGIRTSLILSDDAPATRDRDLVRTDYAHPPMSMAVYMAGISAGGDQGMAGTAGARLLQIGSGTSVATRSLILRAWPPSDGVLATIGSGQDSASSSAPAIPIGAEYQRLALLDVQGTQARVRLMQRHREPGGAWVDADGGWSAWLDVSALLAQGWESPHLTIGNVREGTRAGRMMLSDFVMLDLSRRDVDAVTIDEVRARFGVG